MSEGCSIEDDCWRNGCVPEGMSEGCSIEDDCWRDGCIPGLVRGVVLRMTAGGMVVYLDE